MSLEFEVPTRGDLDTMFEKLRNWGRWGADDQAGTLNHLGPDERLLRRSGSRRPLASLIPANYSHVIRGEQTARGVAEGGPDE